MSRLFEALQRSESERSGIDLAVPGSTAAELLQAAESSLMAIEGFSEVTLAPSPQSRLVSVTEKESLAAEKFRFLGVRMRKLQQQKALKRVVITSTLAEEGKSLVSSNLAITLARRNWQRVLLIDGDLRRPVVADRLGLGSLPGLTEWLQGDESHLDNIYHVNDTSLWVLPAGAPPDNPVELLQSEKLELAFTELGQMFDWILIDSPPLLPLGDTSVWMRMADGVLLVVRESKSEKKQIKTGLEVLEKSKLLGVVLNSCSNTDHKKYYQRYYRNPSPAVDAKNARFPKQA